MRHGRTVRKLGRTASHRRAMLDNMATSLFRAHAVLTTTPKARVVRSVAEKLITLGKRGDMHARRLAARQIKDRTVLKKLFDEIAPQFATRAGGYTRIVKLGWRRGDGASIAKVELLIAKAVPSPAEEQAKKKAGRKAAAAASEKATKEKGKKAQKAKSEEKAK